LTRREFPEEPADPPVAAAETASLQREDRDAAVLAQDPGNRDALNRLSVLRIQQGAFEDAAALIRRFLDADPDFPDAHNNLGVALQGMERTSEAVRHFEKAIELAPQRPEHHYNLGRALQVLGRLTEARESFARAIALRPDYAEAHNSLGLLLVPNDPEQALACFQRALEARPNYADAHSNMGNVFHELGRDEAAMASYLQALAVKPDHAEAHNNLGMALRGLNRDEEAVACFEMAQAIKPDYLDAQLNEGLSRLALGDYATGWKKYAWRRLTPSFSQKNPPQPLWLGNWDIAGKTILLHGEQGLGDTIQFARYVPHVARRGARVILAVQEPLAPLLGEVAGVSVLRAKGEAIPPFDCYCPLPSLPLAFATTLETIPADVPYVRAPADRLAKWRPVMEDLGRPRIGLMWTGSQHARLGNRSIPLRLLLPLLDLPDLHWVALQKEVPEGDLPLLASARIATFLGDRQSDLADAAAMIDMLDLVITIDTSIAHLAGAMGKPVWVLLPFAADWRWLRQRDDSPWYPTARLFRQGALGDWAGVVTQVENALRRFAARVSVRPNVASRSETQ
jgi:tetratricopeptide (TPR) repeat protein